MLFRDLDLTPYLYRAIVLVSCLLSGYSKMVHIQNNWIAMSNCMHAGFCEKAQFSDIEKSLPGWLALPKWV